MIHDLVDGGCRKTTPFQFISLAVVLISSDRVEYQLHRDHIYALAAYLHLQAFYACIGLVAKAYLPLVYGGSHLLETES